jgi:hypothetical protein
MDHADTVSIILIEIPALMAVFGAMKISAMPAGKAKFNVVPEDRTLAACFAVGIFCPVFPASFKRLQGLMKDTPQMFD